MTLPSELEAVLPGMPTTTPREELGGFIETTTAFARKSFPRLY
jgi:hypothetical protein